VDCWWTAAAIIIIIIDTCHATGFVLNPYTFFLEEARPLPTDRPSFFFLAALLLLLLDNTSEYTLGSSRHQPAAVLCAFFLLHSMEMMQ
jgi:hypothetical protein